MIPSHPHQELVLLAFCLFFFLMFALLMTVQWSITVVLNLISLMINVEYFSMCLLGMSIFSLMKWILLAIFKWVDFLIAQL